MEFLFDCRDYRGLRSIQFQPEGVCALVGANGSGKTTLLAAFEFLRNLYVRPTRSAISLDGGHWGLRNLNAQSDTVELSILLDGRQWSLRLAVPESHESYRMSEEVRSGTQPLLHAPGPEASQVCYRTTELQRGEGSLLRLAWELFRDPEIAGLVEFIRSLRTHRHYRLSELREHGSRNDAELTLQRHGENLFSVLRNWRDRRECRASYDFVIDSVRAAFPDFFEDLDFYGDAQTVRAKAYLQGIPEAMPLQFIPDGLLIAMLHLAAVAGSPGRSFVAIDDFENFLHPFAIRSLIESIRGLAAQRDVCVLIATHSPVVLDEFRHEPHRIFVMDFELPDKPVRLDRLRDPEWLAHFSLGDLFARFEFGARLPSSNLPGAGQATGGS